MKDIAIISDGSCDLNEDYISKNSITVLPFYVSIDNEVYHKENKEVKIRDFYQSMVDNEQKFPKSSMPSVNDYLEVFEPLVKANKKIICLTISKNFSGSYNSCTNAKKALLEKYPNALLEIIDSKAITVLQGLLVKEIVKMRNDNLSYEEICIKAKELIPSGRIYFTVNNLDYLKHGGRIGKIAYLIGSVLRINPIITFENDEVSSGGVSISRKRALLKISEMLHSYAKHLKTDLKDLNIVVGYGYDIEEGKVFHQKLLDQTNTSIEFEQIGATISVHTGPYALGVAVLKKYK